MKTNQVMVRKMGDFDVIQRTKDGMFNATALLKQYNYSSSVEKKLDNFFNMQKTKEYIDVIIKREDLDTPKLVYVKSKASRGDSAGTWMHPMLFIDFAMWIDPEFKYDVIKFVYDKMLEYRNENCEAYKELSAAVQKLVNPDFMRKAMQKVAEALNWIVFGSHESQMRNKRGEEDLQKELLDMEKKVATLIDEGFITSYEQLIDYLRRQWKEKNTPKCLK